MNLPELVDFASDKGNFTTLPDYIRFCRRFLDFIQSGLQAVIVSQNETHYRFFQFRADGHFNISRPINTRLMVDAVGGHSLEQFISVIREARAIPLDDEESRTVIRNAIYTMQQAIGVVLDALPAGFSNKARKINGDLFERLIRLSIREAGVTCDTGVISVPVLVDGQVQMTMNYQHYCDIRPNMQSDPFMAAHIRTIDGFFCDDLARFL